MKRNNIPDYKIIYSSRKTLALQVNAKGELVVRAPKRVGKREIKAFVLKNEEWIHKALERAQKRANNTPVYPENEEEIRRLKALAKQVIPPKVEYYAKIIGVKPERVSINRAKTRFGSCSAKNTLNFSCFLMLYGEEEIDYVVVHELCHIIEKNHSARFYALVQSVLPDYKQRERKLKGKTSPN